jgi:hypothetical protein
LILVAWVGATTGTTSNSVSTILAGEIVLETSLLLIFTSFKFDFPYFKIKNRRTHCANVVCKVVIQREKFKAVSHPVWVCWKAMIQEKTVKEERTDKNYSNDNYSYICSQPRFEYLL